MPKKKKLDICRECRKSARPAINAAKLGHANCLTTAYRELGVFNERDNFGATPIHFAARNGRLDCLVWLVTRSGVSPNAVSRNGATAAHDAAAMGHLECLQYLLKSTKCSAHDTTSEGATVLHMACRFGRLAVVEWLMEYSGSSPSEKGANDVTPVHLCAAKGHLECLKLLTSHPQYVPNEQTVHGATAVYFAAQEGCLKCLEWLVNHAQGDPYMMAEDGMAPVHAAAQAGQVSCLQWLVEQSGVPIRFNAEDGATPAHFAAASGEVECLEWILDHGGSIHDRDNLGGTPVHDAAEQGQVAALSTLIQRGVDVTMEDYEGLRPLDLARDNYHTQCAQLLFKALQPTLLVSLTPHHSLSRASAVSEDDTQALQRAEKQRQFEAAMMAGVSEERKEAIWQSAQQKATTGLQPGLKLLLEGEMAASPSDFSLEDHDAVMEGSTQLTPTGSLRHSRHSSRRSSKRSTTSEGFKENLLPYKPRPVLTPTLFEQPKDTAGMPPATKKLKESEALSKVKVQPKDHLRPIQDLETQFKASPIPQRAKFLKKFNIKKKKPAANSGKVTGKEKKKQKKLSKAAKEPPLAPPVVTVEGDKDGSSMLRDESLESGEKKNVVAAELLIPEPMDATTDQTLTSVAEQPPTETVAPAEEEGEEEMEEEGKEKGRVSVYDAVAGAVVEAAIKETIGKKETVQLGSGVIHPTTPPPPDVVVPREKGKKKDKHKKERRSGFEEQAVISHQRGSKSLQNPDETVTVSFVTKTSNVKKSFPVTHHKLLTGDDLSSPESSDEELEGPMRDSFTAPGFERLDSRAFEDFGLDVKDIEEMREMKEREWKKGMDDLEEGSLSSESTLKADDEEDKEDKATVVPKPEADPVDLRSVSGAAIFAIPEDEEDTGDAILQLDSAAVYNKMPHEQERPKRSSTEVLKMVSQMEERKQDKQLTTEVMRQSEPQVRSGSVSEKLKLFGGGMRPVKPEQHPPSPSSGSSELHQQKNVHSTEEKSKSRENELKVMMESSDISSLPLEQTDSVHDSRMMTAAANKREVVRDRLRRPVSSPAFQAITEETTGEGSGELEDKVTPLPKIHPGLSRRHSEERFRLDGLKPLTEESKPLKSSLEKPTSPKGGKYSPPSLRMRLLEGGGKANIDARGIPNFETREKGSTSPGRDKRRSVSVYSPLVVSSTANSSKGEQQGKRERSVSNPSPPQRSSESLALYMNSADLPHLNHLQERHQKEERERAEERVESLLGGPRLSGDDVPLEFRGLQLEGGKRRVYVWKQKAGSLHRMTSMQSVNLNFKSVFIFLKVDVCGPLFHHIFLWLGGGVSEFAMHSVYQHCQGLLQCLPGQPQLHREFQGHESFFFVEMMGDQLLSDHERSQQYLNSSLTRATLYRFNAKASSFEDIPSTPITHHTLTSHTKNTPLILDTPTRVFLWLPSSYWEREEEHQKTVLEIAELFVTHQSYHRWTPITVATQGAEGEGLTAHFPSWPHPPLHLAPQAKQLKLPTIKPPDVTLPANGQTNIWEVSGTDRRPLSQDQFGHFDSSKVYLVQYLHPPHSTLVVYVWVGGEVGEGGEKQLKAALKHAETVGPDTQKPVVIVPAGKEPEQLLYLFKGKFIIHRSKGNSTQTVRLYKVTGTSALKMKGMEVAPSASSLHSSHTFVLSVEGGREVYVWAGQFSSPAERRGALVISRLISKTGDTTKLAEGLETPDFWSHLGGKARHYHFTLVEYPVYSLPTFLSYVVQQGSLTFRQHPPTTRSELKSNGCYLLVYKDQIFVWRGSAWKETAVLDVVKSYITHYHSWKTTADFVVTVVCEEHEGEVFWRWFDLQATPPAAEDEGEEKQTHIQQEDDEKEEVEGDTKQDKQDEPEVSHRQPPTSRPLRLTKSQVTAFENVEKLQADLAAHMQSLEEEEEEKEWEERVKEEKEKKEGKEEEEKGEEREEEEEERVEEKREEGSQIQETKHVSPFRTSQTVRQLSEMIDGLDSMMADLHSQSLTTIDQPPPANSSTKQEKRLSTSSPDLLQDGTMKQTNEDTGQTGLTGSQLAHTLGDSALSIPAPSFSDLLTQSEDNLVDSLPAQKKKHRKSAHSSQPYLVVPVEEGGRVWEVRVREKAPVITLMFKVAEAAGVTLTLTSAIFEICETLKIHRPLEDHELVRDIMAAWPTKNKPKLVLRQFATKNILWSPNPPITKHTITNYVKHNHVPDVTSLLLHSQHGSKPHWKEANFAIRGLGIYIVSGSKHGTQMDLSAGLDHHLYTPLPIRGRTIPSPNPFCFVMKPPSSWREKDMKLYCAPNLNSMAQWVHTIRLLKHGAQLKANYTAMKDRLHKRTGQLHNQQHS